MSLRELGTTRMLAGFLLLGLLGVIAHGALRPLPIERRAARLRWLLALVAWSLPCVLCFAAEAGGGADNSASSGFALRSLTCFGYGSALAAPSFALLWAFDRGQRVPYRVWALGSGAGRGALEPDPLAPLPKQPARALDRRPFQHWLGLVHGGLARHLLEQSQPIAGAAGNVSGTQRSAGCAAGSRSPLSVDRQRGSRGRIPKFSEPAAQRGISGVAAREL